MSQHWKILKLCNITYCWSFLLEYSSTWIFSNYWISIPLSFFFLFLEARKSYFVRMTASEDLSFQRKMIICGIRSKLAPFANFFFLNHFWQLKHQIPELLQEFIHLLSVFQNSIVQFSSLPETQILQIVSLFTHLHDIFIASVK